MTTNNDNLALLAEVRRMAASGEAKAIRRNARIRTVELARALSVSPSTLHRWETGERVPNAVDALRWAGALQELAGLGGDSVA